MKGTINFTKGDATQPIGADNKIITHICNDIGGWGKGFVVAISKRWKQPEQAYRKKESLVLGTTDFVQVAENIWVANMIAQHKMNKDENGNPPIRYDALAACLKEVAAFAAPIGANVHMPRIGCGLAGGRWELIEPIIEDHLLNKNINVTVYDF